MAREGRYWSKSVKRFFQLNTSWTTLTLGTAFTGPSVGDELEIMVGSTASDMTDNAYGGHYFTGKVPCKEDVDLKDLGMTDADLPVFNDEVETSITATFYNADENAAAETFVAGQVQDVYLDFSAGTDEMFGNPYVGDTPNIVCMNLNSSEWDRPEKYSVDEGYTYEFVKGQGVVATSIAGRELKSVSTPLRHSAVASMVAYCFEAPVVGPDGMRVKIRLDADDTNAPGTDMTAHLYAGHWYVDDNGDIQFGVEDEDTNSVGVDSSDTVTMDFT